jgi:hypothetical protein
MLADRRLCATTRSAHGGWRWPCKRLMRAAAAACGRSPLSGACTACAALGAGPAANPMKIEAYPTCHVPSASLPPVTGRLRQGAARREGVGPVPDSAPAPFAPFSRPTHAAHTQKP